MDKAIVKIVEERATFYCEVCGRVASESMALHHRKLKSRGGKDTPANLIRVHHECHNLGSDSIHLNPAIAEDRGHMVSSWKDPEETPFLRPDGSWVLLDNEGSIKVLGEGKNEYPYSDQR
jgi:hypothetical protein